MILEVPHTRGAGQFQRLGFERDEALTLGRALAGLTAHTKGVRLGIFEPASADEVRERRSQLEEGEQLEVRLLGRMIPVVRTPEGLRAAEKGKAGSPASVERYLQGKFGDAIEKTVDPAHRRSRPASPATSSWIPSASRFENYDGLGRWRTMDQGKPVDASGKLAFTDVDGDVPGREAAGRAAVGQQHRRRLRGGDAAAVRGGHRIGDRQPARATSCGRRCRRATATCASCWSPSPGPTSFQYRAHRGGAAMTPVGQAVGSPRVRC